MTKFKFSIVLALVALFALTFTSCEKDEGDSPDYVGTWVDEQEDNSTGQPVTIIMTMTLTESTFDMAITVDLGNNFIVQGGGMKGELSVTGDHITITPTSVGAINENRVVEWVNKGEDGWDEALEEIGMEEIQIGTYVVEGNELTITFEGIDQVFTRV